MNIIGLFWWIFVFKSLECINIKIHPFESAFVKFSGERDDFKEIIYKNPLEHKLNISASIGNLVKTKNLEPLNYVTNVYTDKARISIQANPLMDSLIINAICLFSHDNLASLVYQKICCEVTMKKFGKFSKIFDHKFCTMNDNQGSSACSVQFIVAKDNFDFRNSSEVQLDISSRVFGTQDSKCLSNASDMINLAFGYPAKVIIMQDLLVKWDLIDQTKSFGELLIGVPADVMEAGSKSAFPVKLNSTISFSKLEIKCFLGKGLKFSATTFDSSRFKGKEDDVSDTEKIISVEEPRFLESPSNENSVELLMNLWIQHQNTVQKYNQDNWIRCKVVKGFIDKTKHIIERKREDTENKILIPVHFGQFIIFPIMKNSVYFSILNPVLGPIVIEKNNYKILSAYQIGDYSFSDISEKTKCQPISKSVLRCPFDNDLPVNTKMEVIQKPNWNVILSLLSWRKLVTIPIELWQAVDWRLDITDRNLNEISNWNYKRKSNYKCRPVYQITRSKLLARLKADNYISDKSYFGQSEYDQTPLLDMSGQIGSDNIQFSNRNIGVTIDNGVMLFKVNNIGSSDLSIVDNQGKKVVIELIHASEQSVSIIDMDISCIHDININRPVTSDELPFHKISINYEPSKTPNESCYFNIILIFSDNTKSNLLDYKHTQFELKLIHSENSITIENLENYLYEPFQYKEPGIFKIQLYESKQCSPQQLIFAKNVNLYARKSEHKTISTKKSDSIVTDQITSTKPSKKPYFSTRSIDQQSTVTTNKGIDTETIFLTMKILIGLVVLVVLIVAFNFIIKFRNRKSACLLDRQLNNCQIYGQVEKLTTSAYVPVDITSQNSNNQHPPLLPPPGPLYNSSNSSQIDLAVNATPDRFWDLSRTVDSSDRKMASNHMLLGIQMNAFNGQGHSVTFPNIFSNSRASSSPHSDQVDYSKLSHSRPMQPSQNEYNYPPGSIHDSDSLASVSGSKTSSQIAVMVPPCPPLRWNNNWNTSQFPVYFPNDKDVNIDPSISQFSNEQSSQISLTPSHSSSWEIKQPLILPPLGFNSIDNVCEKSSGLGSLTSTQPGSDCSKKESTHTNSPKVNSNYSTTH